jgi:hypothetical protein
LGFHKTAEGVFAPPGAGKDVIRTIHSIQRDSTVWQNGKKALGTFFYPREWSMISGCGSRSALTRHLTPSFSPTPTVVSWIRAITGTES